MAHEQFRVEDRVTFQYGGMRGTGVVIKAAPGSITVMVSQQVPDPAQPGATRLHQCTERLMGRSFSKSRVWLADPSTQLGWDCS